MNSKELKNLGGQLFESSSLLWFYFQSTVLRRILRAKDSDEGKVRVNGL